MRRRIQALALLVMLSVAAVCLAATSEFTGKCIGVTDGDTIKVLKDGKEIKVRLNGIDCPEKGQAYGRKAKKAAADLAFLKVVTVVEHGTDRYGRTIGDVILPDGRNLNQEMVRLGMAWWYRKYAKGDKVLEGLEAEAREAKVGLWHDPKAEAPWKWRKR